MMVLVEGGIDGCIADLGILLRGGVKGGNLDRMCQGRGGCK